jgi:secreted PhoX family phosphatase
MANETDDEILPGVPTMGEIMARRLSRRDVLAGMASAAALTGLGAASPVSAAPAPGLASPGLAFKEISHGSDGTVHVPDGYRWDTLIRWGDPVAKDAPAFAARALTAEAQAKQFGYNCDFIAFMPLPVGSTNSDHGLLVVNHEYSQAQLMFAGLQGGEWDYQARMTKAQTEVELESHGASVIEIRKTKGEWRVVHGSPYARRVTMTTPCTVSGPAAGHARLKTSADPTGQRVLGTLNNCAGAVTPWGTVLTAEENFDLYFWGKAPNEADQRRLDAYGFRGRQRYAWANHHARFDLSKEPNEPNRFGWMVEIDPYDPNWTPVKRTALGRMKHEGGGVAFTQDGRVVVYQGDDEQFQYVYRFISAKKYDTKNRAANRNLLDSGTLDVARFDEGGVLQWLPLKWGTGPLTPANGFESEADVLIDTRRAARLVGATPMDRPEDVDVNPVNGRIYAIFTNNSNRKADDPEPARRPDAANPRSVNHFGHILEVMAPGTAKGPDHGAPAYRWDIFILAGDPRKPDMGARYHPRVSANGWFGAPDNCAFDRQGRLWIATDQGNNWNRTGTCDGIWACEVAGGERALTKFFTRMPIGAECCGPCFTPDGKTLFVAVQHPAADGVGDLDYENPVTRWPDFKPDMPPRPSVIVITKRDGGLIGS